MPATAVADALAGAAVALPAAVAAAEPPVSRRRLRGKTTARPGFPAGPPGGEGPSEDSVPRHAGLALSPLRPINAPNCSTVVELLRRKHCRREEVHRVANGADGTREMRGRRKASYALLKLPQRIELCVEVLAAAEVPVSLLEGVRQYQKNFLARTTRNRKGTRSLKDKHFFVHGPCLLLTYLGNPLLEAAGVKCPDAAVDAVDEAACRVRHSEAGHAAMKSCREFAEKLAKDQPTPRFARAVEVCPRTWSAERRVLLHLHVALVRQGQPFHVSTSALQFENTRPTVSRQTCVCRDKRSAGTAMLYYCVIHKVGQLGRGGNVEPFHEYHVNQEWITNLVQAGKVNEEVARSLRARRQELVHHRQNLERLVAEQRNLTLRARASHIQVVCAAQIAKFKDVPLVTQHWLPQYQHIKQRYMFLVLQRPSGTGKTSFAKYITGTASEVLEVNCSACPEPDLRNLDPEQRNAILFDEATPTMVLSQRRWFQAPPCWIDLGCSTTNCHKYQVWVPGMMMIVASNT